MSEIFINGREQIVSMLKTMDHTEKVKLIRQLMLRNEKLGRELLFESFSFEQVTQVDPNTLFQLGDNIHQSIWALALKQTEMDFQRDILRAINRKKAEKIYTILMEDDFRPKAYDIARAREKVVHELVEIMQLQKKTIRQ